jgi:hypothetical protein
MMTNRFLIVAVCFLCMVLVGDCKSAKKPRRSVGNVSVLHFEALIHDAAVQAEQSAHIVRAAGLRSIGKETRAAAERYASLHKYTFESVRRWDADEVTRCGGLTAIKQLFAKRKNAPDWVLYVDGDVAITDMRKSVRTLVRRARQQSSGGADDLEIVAARTFELAATSGVNKHGELRVNPSVALVRNSQYSIQLIDEVCRVGPQHPGVGGWIHEFGERVTQAAVDGRAALFGHRFNANPMFWEPGTFAAHFGAVHEFGSSICNDPDSAPCIDDVQSLARQAIDKPFAPALYRVASLRQNLVPYNHGSRTPPYMPLPKSK